MPLTIQIAPVLFDRRNVGNTKSAFDKTRPLMVGDIEAIGSIALGQLKSHSPVFTYLLAQHSLFNFYVNAINVGSSDIPERLCKKKNSFCKTKSPDTVEIMTVFVNGWVDTLDHQDHSLIRHPELVCGR